MKTTTTTKGRGKRVRQLAEPEKQALSLSFPGHSELGEVGVALTLSHWPSSSSGRSSAASPFFALASGPLLRAPPAILVVLSVPGKKTKNTISCETGATGATGDAGSKR